MNRTWAVGPNEGKPEPIVESAFRKALAQARYNEVKERYRLKLLPPLLNLAGPGEQLAQMEFFRITRREVQAERSTT